MRGRIAVLNQVVDHLMFEEEIDLEKNQYVFLIIVLISFFSVLVYLNLIIEIKKLTRD